VLFSFLALFEADIPTCLQASFPLTLLALRGILKQTSPYPRLKKRRTSLMRLNSFSKILYEFSSRKKLPSNLCLCYNGTHDYFDIEGTERVEITAII